MRGDDHLASIALVLDVFGIDADVLVFLGGCVPGLYARPTGSPIRPPHEIVCLPTMESWILQERQLTRLCSSSRLLPLATAPLRYQLPGSDLIVDVIPRTGLNVGGSARWMREASDQAAAHVLPDGRLARVVTPPYFVLLRLAEFLERGADLIPSKEMNEIVFVALEVDDLSDQVATAGLSGPIADLWRLIFERHDMDVGFIPDIVSYHLRWEDARKSHRADATLAALAAGVVASRLKPADRRPLSERTFRLGILKAEIGIKLWANNMPGGCVTFTQSHHLKTPGQFAAYCPSRAWGEDEDAAFSRAQLGVMALYEKACREGHAPREQWLVPNPNY